jgi:hypothetical protein
MVAMICLAATLAACHDPYDADVEPGPNGEPGSALKQVYSREFKVAKGDYFAALSEFYAFASREGFEKIDFGNCFAGILDTVSNEKVAPCIGMFAAKGAPTKAHMTFTIVARSFYRSDHHDHLTCRIDLYINDSYQPAHTLAPSLRESVDSRLQQFDRTVAHALTEKQ